MRLRLGKPEVSGAEPFLCFDVVDFEEYLPEEVNKLQSHTTVGSNYSLLV